MSYDPNIMPRNLDEWEILINTKTQEALEKYKAEVVAAKAKAEAEYPTLPDEDKPTLAEYIAQAVNTVAPAQTRQEIEEHYKAAGYYPQEPEPLGPVLTLEQVKAQKIAEIDAETSACILSGFDYPVNGQTLHFNYDRDDQANFESGAQGCMMRRAGIPGIPDSVTWNGYRPDGSLVRLTLNEEEFIGLYLAALAHKNACMEAGGKKKAELVG